MSASVGTKLSPQAVFKLVATLPKDLQERFRLETRVEEKQESEEFVMDPTYKYDHVLGLSWLTDNDIPNTQEELDAQREIVFKTMVSGAVTYNVGQFFVLFPEIVYGTSDISDTLMVVEVMDELDFPAELELITKDTAEIRDAGYMERGAIAIRAALQSYVASGKIKIHQAGMRMYMCEERYQFETRYIDPDAPVVTFKEAVRRHRRGG